MKWYRVIRIYRVWAQSEAEAIKKVREEPVMYQTSEFGKEEQAKSWLAVTLKQIFG